MYRKIIHAATTNVSFVAASESLVALAELEVSSQRVRRAAEHIGEERIAERQAEVAAFEKLPLPEQRQCPATQMPVPDSSVAVVEMDGGRLQERDRLQPQRNENGTFWRETKVGVLLPLWSFVISPQWSFMAPLPCEKVVFPG